MEKRVKSVAVLILVLLALLGVRVFYVACVRGDELAKEAVAQRTKRYPVQSSRGVIYDRNMLAITSGKSVLKAAVLPGECEDLDLVSRIVGEQVDPDSMRVYELNALNEDTLKLFDMKGVVVFDDSDRYGDDGFLSHIIGYCYDGGGFGIEKAFDGALTVEGRDSIAVTTDAYNNAIAGLGYKMDGGKSYKGVKLTIDYHIQSLAEQAMDKQGIAGAAVVVQVDSGDIVAMVSRPNFSQKDLVSHLGSENGELINRALAAYDAGSIFKTVLAAAATEEGICPTRMGFECTGKVDINGREFVCNKEEGHGHLTMGEGVAYSCNTVFYHVGQMLGVERIAKYAQGFGFGEKVMKIDYMGEQAGNIPGSVQSLQELANISIGQGDIQVTPLQAADMMTTIAGGGERKQLTLVKGVVDENGECKDVEPVSLGRVISRDTADTLKEMLVDTVEFGTGANAMIDGWGSGGKTGSAQTGWLRDGKTMTHGWFAGFFPADNPQYVCVVMAEDGKQGGTSAAPVFRQIGEGIKQLGR